MLFVFCSWIMIGLSAFLWGKLITDIFFKTDEERCLLLIIFCGLGGLTVFAEYFSLLYKVGTAARLCVLLSDAALIIIKKDSILLTLKKYKDKLSWQKILWTVISCILILPLASSYIMNSDTYLYHAQSIRWIEEYGAVKGIGNLHSRIAFDSSFLCLQALFGLEEIFGRPMHSVNSFVAWVMLIYAGASMKVWRKKRIYLSDGIKLGVIFYLNDISNEFSSPGTDLFAHCLTFFIFIEWISNIEDKEDSIDLQIILSILSVYAMTLKLSAALLVLFSIVPGFRLLREKKMKKLCLSLISGIIVLLPFFCRNIIISGYLIYPMEQLDFFDVDWKIPAWMSRYERLRTKAWAEEIFGIEDLTAPITTWFPYWRAKQSKEILWILCADSVICFLGGVYALWYGLRKHNWNLFSVSVIMSLNYIYWFLSAPNVRFGRSIIIIPLSLFCGWVLNHIQLISIKNRTFTAALMYICLIYPFYGIFTSARAEERHFIRNVDYETFDMIKFPMKNVILFIPVDESRNGYYEFPVVINEDTALQLELRGDSLQAGFRKIN